MKKPKTSQRAAPVRPAAPATRPPTPLANSPAQAKREGARLRRGRQELDSSAAPGDTDIRSSLI